MAVVNSAVWCLKARSAVWENNCKRKGWRSWMACALASERPGPAEDIGLCYLEKVQNIPRRGTEAEPKLENMWDSQVRVAGWQK